MIHQEQLGASTFGQLRKLVHLKRKGQLSFGGNSRLKIYGRLSCKSGVRMKRENRVFFTTEFEATMLGYRPCGHCMKEAYLRWKRQASVRQI